MSKKVSLPKAIEILSFDGVGTTFVYPKKVKQITFDSWLHTELMKDAGHNSRLVGTVARTILTGYYQGRLGGSGSSVGETVVKEQIKRVVFESSDEGKKAIKHKKSFQSELSKEIQSKRIEAEEITYDMSKYDILDKPALVTPPPVPKVKKDE